MILRECEVRYKRTKIDAPESWPARITSSRDVHAMLRATMTDLPTERVVAVLLNTKNKPIGLVTCAQGGTSSCALACADVFRPALVAGAPAMILAHNHPSGDVAPSADDIALTSRLVAAAEILGVRILDHVIVGDGKVFSFLDAGIFPRK
ncbi:MAG: JAB domain-containing protein [Acidobacteria bacterium]|nr:JAB domain-containing protein [Acidobacteriota bacterium]